MIRGRRILLAVTGSIAAYKSAFLTRELVKAGAEVRVLLSSGATRFISPLTFSTLSGSPVLSDQMVPDPETGEWNDHVHWGRWADLLLIAPATANTIAKLAHGMADDLLGLIRLSAECPVHFAPAMDLEMYQHPAVRSNVQALQEQGARLIPSQSGELASGSIGYGRMEEPERILEHLEEAFQKAQRLRDRKVLVTAGPTHEAIDPVRYIGNRASGKMGVALAEAASKRGAEVTLVLGPGSVRPADPRIEVIDVESAQDMYEVCLERFPDLDLAIMAAAVADHRPAKVQADKIKKGAGKLEELELEETEDILAALGAIKEEGQLLIGFALESEQGSEEAERKLRSKNADLIVLNSLKDEGAGFRTDTNVVTIHRTGNDPERIPLESKSSIAERVLDRAESFLF